MDDQIVSVVSPPPLVYRIARRGRDPFAPPPWELAGPDGTFGNRFDDPSLERGVPHQERFRAISCASTAEGAFGETLARFRPSIALLAELQGIDDGESRVAVLDDAASASSVVGVVPAAWRLRRVVAQTCLNSSLRFVDLASPVTHQYLRRAIASGIVDAGLRDLDLSAVIGPQRTLTQRIARHVYERHDREGTPLFAGLRYLSRLNPEWECWAVFADRIVHTPGPSITIAPDNPTIVTICNLLRLRIESTDG